MAGEYQSMILKGEFLVAMPTLQDPNFSHSVICICEFSMAGAMGLIVNRPYPDFSAADIFDELSIASQEGAGTIPVYNGGPVNIGDVFVLHGPPFDWAGCLPIHSWLALSNTRDILEAIAMGRGPESYTILLGCSGWAGGQLEMELKGNAWITLPADRDIIFNTPVDERWRRVLTLNDIDPAMLSNSFGTA